MELKWTTLFVANSRAQPRFTLPNDAQKVCGLNLMKNSNVFLEKKGFLICVSARSLAHGALG